MRYTLLAIVFAGVVGPGWLFAGASPEDVQNQIQEKAKIQQLSIEQQNGNVVLQGQAALLKDKEEAAKIAGKAFKSPVVNQITLEPSNRTDSNINVDVDAAIQKVALRYNAFNSISTRVVNGHVFLTGEVRDAYLVDRAEKAAMSVPGVQEVVNQIQPLPVSHEDDRIRVAVYRRLANNGSLFRYFLGTQPSISIIVRNSRVELQGTVDSEVDRVKAGFVVGEMFGILSVENHLRVG